MPLTDSGWVQSKRDLALFVSSLLSDLFNIRYRVNSFVQKTEPISTINSNKRRKWRLANRAFCLNEVVFILILPVQVLEVCYLMLHDRCVVLASTCQIWMIYFRFYLRIYLRWVGRKPLCDSETRAIYSKSRSLESSLKVTNEWRVRWFANYTNDSESRISHCDVRRRFFNISDRASLRRAKFLFDGTVKPRAKHLSALTARQMALRSAARVSVWFGEGLVKVESRTPKSRRDWRR